MLRYSYARCIPVTKLHHIRCGATLPRLVFQKFYWRKVIRKVCGSMIVKLSEFCTIGWRIREWLQHRRWPLGPLSPYHLYIKAIHSRLPSTHCLANSFFPRYLINSFECCLPHYPCQCNQDFGHNFLYLSKEIPFDSLFQVGFILCCLAFHLHWPE